VFFTVFGSMGLGVGLAYGAVTAFLRWIGHRGTEPPSTAVLADIASRR
jgi:hypothetical protein